MSSNSRLDPISYPVGEGDSGTVLPSPSDPPLPVKREVERAIEELFDRFQRFGVNLGLTRIQALLQALGNPQEQFPIVHVAGSNGKGSVCAYLSSVLTHAGYRVGRYTSPHLVDWSERICINEQPIALTDLLTSLQQVAALVPSPESLTQESVAVQIPTQFEILTAAAFTYFAQQRVEIAIIEVGLGGRLDATNVWDHPLVTVITSISREHWQVLGSTVAEIAGEKAGILKLGCPAVIGGLPEEAKRVVQQRLGELHCPALWPEPGIVVGTAEDAQGLPLRQVVSQGITYPLGLQGDFQLQNSALAIAVLHCLRQQNWVIPDAAIQAGMAQTQWLGRVQWIRWNDRPLLLDGAHNPGAALVLRDYVDRVLDQGRYRPPVHWVMGMLATKEHQSIFQALLRSGDRLMLVPVPDHQSADPAALAVLARSVCPVLGDCQVYGDLHAALQGIRVWDQSGDRSREPFILCGSLYLIGHFLKHYYRD